MMKFELKNDNRGLTLMELLVGVAILAVIITPLLHVYVTGANTARKNKLYNDATLAAQNKIEEIEATDMAAYLTTENGFSLVADNGDPNYGKYVKTESAGSGGSDFDAKIVIDTDSRLNGTEEKPFKIPVSNQMDAVFAMQEVDDTAKALFRGSADEGFSKLKRYITIDVDYVSETDKSTCKITVTFNYSGSARKVYTDSDGKEHYEYISFTYPIVSEMNLTPRPGKGDAFAVYLFFKAYEWGDESFNMGKTVINNNTEYSFNAFLVDVNDHNSITGTEHYVEYKPKVAGTKADLLTNMNNVIYKVYKSSGSSWQVPEKEEIGLVKTGAAERIYNITVEIYRGGDKLAAMSSTKLDYSVQQKG